MVDCRSLIEFCRTFDQPRNMYHHRRTTTNPLSTPFCEHSPSAALDIALLVLVLTALTVLTLPCLTLILAEAWHLLPFLALILTEAPLAYALAFLITLALAVAAWEIVGHQFRKCGNPYCKGLRKAVEFDIQLEPEECVRYLPPVPKGAFGAAPLEIGENHRELEAELKKMAPPNGRTVLIFRSPCGCPVGRMEVWGAKKVRRIKK